MKRHHTPFGPLVLSVLLLLGSAAFLQAAPTPTPTPTPTATPKAFMSAQSSSGWSIASAPTTASTGTVSVDMSTGIITITPTGACTFNATGGLTGAEATFVITTSGTTSRVLTWGTNFKTTATLATGTVTAKLFTVTFRCLDGTTWIEIARTSAM